MNQPRKWIRVTHCHNIPLREGRAVKAGNHEVAIFNLGDRFLAIDNRCPHGGGPLSEGIVSGPTVVCPLHAWKVNLETGSVTSPGNTRPCLATFSTRVENGVVSIEVPIESATNEDVPADCIAHGGVASWLTSSRLANG